MWRGSSFSTPAAPSSSGCRTNLLPAVPLLPHSIRPATSADLPLLPGVELRAVQMFVGWERETGLTAVVRENVSELDELDAACRGGRLWVATSRETNEVVAFAQAEVLDGMAHLDEINVLPEHARRGVGSALVEAVCDWAVGAGYTHITLSTFRDVPWNRPFYERRGFRVIETGELHPEHAALVESERARGLRTDLRVMMSRALLAHKRSPP